MRKVRISLVAMMLVLALVATSPGAGALARPLEPTYGASIGTWAGRWWQWIFSVPLDEHHPFNDSTGANCGQGQSARQMWFLAGVSNTGGEVGRGCEVPKGRAIFFPVLNTECSTLEKEPFYGEDAAALKACAESFVMEDMYAQLDGADLNMATVTSDVYDFTVTEGWNIAGYFEGADVGDTGQSVASGTHVVLPPLPPGTYTLEFGGYFPLWDYQLDITYRISVS